MFFYLVSDDYYFSRGIFHLLASRGVKISCHTANEREYDELLPRLGSDDILIVAINSPEQLYRFLDARRGISDNVNYLHVMDIKKLAIAKKNKISFIPKNITAEELLKRLSLTYTPRRIMLSTREQFILDNIMKGKDVESIARLLNRSVTAIYAGRNRIINNMGLNSTSLVALQLCQDISRLNALADQKRCKTLSK
ncbi:LuxR C-terminal-related transcriptional regulator [Entomohabitans teleogrylli]|uniref:LuxR C-terminal-related transcriptional regulator n=1 Tax=Entomohabitans teleogrylli TaxID=1384589 RepID=UPI00073D80A8|nr:LuxR C-terminal-related transcriptional regulator [Entomohabitans teleogrylli]